MNINKAVAKSNKKLQWDYNFYNPKYEMFFEKHIYVYVIDLTLNIQSVSEEEIHVN